MIDVAKIQDSLVGLVGFKQPINPDYAIIDANNQMSESGYFVTDNHFAKIEYLKDTQDYLDISDADFNAFLVNMKRASISNVCNQVFSNADYIDRNLLYKNAFNKVNLETLPEGFIGYKICVDDTKDVAFKITRVLLDFQGSGTIKLLLWNNAKLEVIESQEIIISSDHQVAELNWVVNNTKETYKGEYYLGYIYTDALGVKPYKRDWNNANVMSYLTHLYIEKVNYPNHLTEMLFDISKLQGFSGTTGLNFDITVYDDFTDLIINNKNLFARAINIDLVISFLQAYLASLRSNRNEKLASELYQKIMIEIEGTRAGDNVISVKGLRPQLLSEISNIKAEIEKLKENYFGIGINVITVE